MTRLAVYYMPPAQSALAEAATRWLHRQPAAGQRPRRLPAGRYETLLAAPRHYGFHATIQPPFHPAAGVDVDLVAATLQRLCSRHQSLVLPPLAITLMHSFFCLRPAAPVPGLTALAAEAVRAFLPLRQMPGAAEKARRQASGLTARQEDILQKWGYPYLMEEYRFHMTLTGRIESAAERVLLYEELEEFFPRTSREDVAFSSLCLCREENGEPLELLHRFHMAEAASSLPSTGRCQP